MNSCVLMVEVISEPELRQTSDNLEVANMMVEFPGLRSDDPTARIRAVGWGNLATEISEKYHAGDRVILEGRLGMNVIEMKEGYKEKRAELVISRIFPVSSNHVSKTSESSNVVVNIQATPSPAPQPVAQSTPKTAEYTQDKSASTNINTPETSVPGNYTNEELDDIPF